jgi:hypothetical protein
MPADGTKVFSVAGATYPHVTGSYAAGEYESIYGCGPTLASGMYAPGSGVLHRVVTYVKLSEAGGCYVKDVYYPDYRYELGLDPSGVTKTLYNNPAYSTRINPYASGNMTV